MKAMRRLLPHPMLSLSLLVIWLILNTSIDPGHLLLGAAFGVGVPLLARPYWPERPPFHRFPLLWKLFFQVNWDILWACITVVWLTFTRRSTSLQPQFATIPLECRNPYALALLVGIVSITPGTVAADLDPEHQLLLVHWLHEPYPDRAAGRIKSRYEKPLKEILE